MIKVSQDQALARWDALPIKLKEALYSDVNSDFLWRTCEAEHIPKEKIYNVSAIAGYVLLGFLHPGDMAQELKDLGIVPQVADTISAAINKRVFDPIRIDLEKIYEPPSAFTRSVVEIKPFAANTQEPKPFVFQPDSRQGIKIEAPIAPKPIGEIKPPAAPSFPPETIVPSPFKIGVPSAPSLVKPPAPSASAVEPPPAILHEEPLAPPSKSTQEFKIEIPQPKLSEMKPAVMAPTKPAVLELGSSPLKTLEGKEAKTSDKVRVVHYTEMRTSLGKVPAPMSPTMQGREIKEITMEAPPFNATPSTQPGTSRGKSFTPTRIEPPPVPRPPIPPPRPPQPRVELSRSELKPETPPKI